MNKGFSIKEALQYGWKTTLKNFWFWAGLLLIMFAVRWLGSAVTGMACGNSVVFCDNRGLAFLISLVSTIIAIIVQMAAMKIALKFIDGKVPAYSDLWTDLDWMQIWYFILAAFLIGCGVAVGLVLLVIPGFYLALSWCFASYVIVDKKATAIQAMKESWHMADGVRWMLLGLFIVLVLANILGALLFAIGLFWSIPTTLLATAWVYRKLSGAIVADDKVVVPVPTPEAPMMPVADIS